MHPKARPLGRLLGPCFKTGGKRPSPGVCRCQKIALHRLSTTALAWHDTLPEEGIHALPMLSQIHLASRPCHLLAALEPSSEPPKEPDRRIAQKRTTRSDMLRLHAAANGSRTLGAQRLQGLFHSLSKVLFIFRSHYLFAIGLGEIFSLRRSTPAVCTALSNCATHGDLGVVELRVQT